MKTYTAEYLSRMLAGKTLSGGYNLPEVEARKYYGRENELIKLWLGADPQDREYVRGLVKQQDEFIAAQC